MNAPRPMGPAAVAGGATAAGPLAFTGSNVLPMIVLGLALLASGLLLLRSARYRGSAG